jgi:uncharacterized protein YbjT (DUF2867 family)
MKILLTGATGYIGKRLLPALVKDGHKVVCCVRDKARFNPPIAILSEIDIVEADFLDEKSLSVIPEDLDGAFYLMHSMSVSEDYEWMEKTSAQNFRSAMLRTSVKHVVYLSGIVNESTLSKHLSSRLTVEKELSLGAYQLTTLRAGIIIGSGSASYEIVRDLVEKLPVMITPKWLNTKSQPISVSDVIKYLLKTIGNQKVFGNNYDIGGPNIMSYKQMLMDFAKYRRLKIWIFTLPIMTPKLSSYWLYFVTSTSFKLAQALVSSMKVEVICRPSNLNDLLGMEPISYEQALSKTFHEIADNQIISSWKDSLISGQFNQSISAFLEVPTFGCLKDKRTMKIKNREETFHKIWSIGGSRGWYYANWLWQLRGFIDKLFGGVGLRRGRTSPNEISTGDAIDFWRVLYADKKEGRLLLFAEMKLPGDAWLEFRQSGEDLIQTATFRPKGIWGRIYWYLVFPLHGIIFGQMLRKLIY